MPSRQALEADCREAGINPTGMDKTEMAAALRGHTLERPQHGHPVEGDEEQTTGPRDPATGEGIALGDTLSVGDDTVVTETGSDAVETSDTPVNKDDGVGGPVATPDADKRPQRPPLSSSSSRRMQR